ncbi:MAG TPA: CDP-alcohol phosphatidyltransferase family protein [Acidimicrobiia bacterium]|nr:CDP-alcohol phosphatidyltransferase family protein [Acidimicrobiia bacterium]
MPGPDARVLTVPNVISLGRLALVPVFLWLLWARDRPIAAAALFAVLGATDWIDGYIARHFDQGSELGKILDPTADRVLLVAGALALLVERMPVAVDVLLVVVLVREVAIALVTVGLALAGARRIDVVWAGKAGTLALMFALPLLLVADRAGDDTIAALAAVGGWGFAIGGIALGYYAAVKYVPAARVALRDGRAARLAEVDT